MDNDHVVNFGEEDAKKRMFQRPSVVLAHLVFRVSAIVVYLLGTWFTYNYIVLFLVIISLLSIDFWTVKNITGRLLVGYRWWNIVDSEGNSHWKFESRKDMSRVDVMESRVFWLALIGCPALWLLFAFTTIMFMELRWLIITVMGLCMCGANLYGYLRCRWSSRQELSAFISQTIFRSVLSRAAETAVNNPSQSGTNTV